MTFLASRLLLLLFVVLGCVLPLGLSAQIAVQAPVFAARESSVYRQTIGNKVTTNRYELVLVTEGGKTWLELNERGEGTESFSKIDTRTLQPFFTQTTTTNSDSQVRRTTEVLSSKIKGTGNQFLVSDISALSFTMRGYPFATSPQADLIFLGSTGPGAGSFTLQIKVLANETITVPAGTYPCHHVELALGGILGALFGSSNLWFSATSPYMLVRSEGLSAGPGSPKRVTELQSYSTTK